MSNPPTLNYWPLVMAIEDCLVPQSVEVVCQAAAEMSSEDVGSQLYLEAVIAELYLDKN